MSAPSLPSTPDRTIVAHTPAGDVLEKPLLLTPEHPSALTFCVLGTLAEHVVLTSPRPHLFIYHALLNCARESNARRWNSHLTAYETKAMHGRLTTEVLQRFKEDAEAAHGFPRYSTISGRLWSPLQLAKIGTFSVLTLWPNLQRRLSLYELQRIRRLTRAKLPMWVADDPVCQWIEVDPDIRARV